MKDSAVTAVTGYWQLTQVPRSDLVLTSSRVSYKQNKLNPIISIILQHFTNFTAFCRYRNGQLLDLSDRGRYEGATVDQPSLVIKKVSREDNGRYSCVLENNIGSSESKGAATLTVLCK